MKHGNEIFFIKDEGLVNGPLFPEELLCKKNELRRVFPHDFQPKPGEKVPRPTRMFCRLFSKGAQPDARGLIELGMHMENEKKDETKDNRDSDIPAGYTYLGQFIDHDITLDRDTKLTKYGKVEPGDIENFRTLSLDLDSVYLDGPRKNPELYNCDQRTFKIGKTSPVKGSFINKISFLRALFSDFNGTLAKLFQRITLPSFDNDLPRKDFDAIIGDCRNDENLVVAQTHLAFLKFHNALAAANPKKSFEELRREVTLYYQAIILKDFLPKILDQQVLNDVLKNGRKFYTDDKKDCMPIEFSVAAFRLHSMVRPTYEWNCKRNSNTKDGIATLNQLFEFSGGSGSRGEGDRPFGDAETLPSDWIIDWYRFYDFSNGGRHRQLNLTRKLDTNLAFGLKNLPQFEKMQPKPPDVFLSLATRALLRGRLVSLPSGQLVATAIGEIPLTPEDICEDLAKDQTKTLKDHGFDKDTPLWYYILREAMVQANGNHLGKVGSRIVAETFVGLIQNSPTNVIAEQPALSFSMSKLLTKIPNNINPLGD